MAGRSRGAREGALVLRVALCCVSAASTMGLTTGCAGPARSATASAVDHGRVGEALDAYDRMRQLDGPDAELLGRIAAVLLEQEASGADRELRRQAVQELAGAGTAGTPALERLAYGGSAARVIALEALARRGDERAARELRSFADDEDSEARAAAVLAMDPEQDRPALLDALGWPSPRARENAASKLAALAPEGEARARLEETSRVDPEPSVRAAAVRALGAYGPPALGALRERLSDPVPSVRMAAVDALIRADRDQAWGALGSLFATPPSSQGIEAARLMVVRARASDEDRGARAYLISALRADEPSLRSQAGVALVSLQPREDLRTALETALRAENDPGAKLSIACALLRQNDAESDAREALRSLMQGGLEMSALQAAAVLAEGGDEGALATLVSFLRRPDTVLRRAAARALARDAMRPDDAREALRDRDAQVRIGAAGAILAASTPR